MRAMKAAMTSFGIAVLCAWVALGGSSDGRAAEPEGQGGVGVDGGVKVPPPCPAFPPWREHRFLPQQGGEVTPFVFKGKPYRMENVLYHGIADKPVQFNFHEDHCRVRDLTTGLVLSHPMVNHYFTTATVRGDEVYAFGADYGTNRPWWTCQTIDLIRSRDLVSWAAPVPVIHAENESLFNNSIAGDGRRYYMCYESDDPRYPKFTFKFAVSEDLVRWVKIPGGIYAQDKYGGGPSLYFCEPWFYLTYVNEVKAPNPNGGKEYYDTRIARTKDFVHWEEPPEGRPVLSPDFAHAVDPVRHPGVFELNASDAEFEEENGRVRAYWCGGNQNGLGDSQTAVCDGTLKHLFESFFLR